MKGASVKALEKLNFKPYFSFGSSLGWKPTTRPKPSKPGDETGPSTSGIEPAGSETKTSTNKGSERATIQGVNTALEGISSTLEKEGLQPTRITQGDRQTPSSETIVGAVDSLQVRGGKYPTRADVMDVLVCDLGAERPAPDREAESPN
ncbi:hypothetical protein JTB14_019119 [Gonioctena quinquepunctata]|nr:hypothetical protein JTB14_019119 [Gonioctena quinquepunctata]